MSDTFTVSFEIAGVKVSLEFPKTDATFTHPDEVTADPKVSNFLVGHFSEHVEILVTQVLKFIGLTQALRCVNPELACPNLDAMAEFLDSSCARTTLITKHFIAISKARRGEKFEEPFLHLEEEDRVAIEEYILLLNT